MGGEPLMLRQQDKAHAWDESGLKALIPNGLAMSLLGYHYHCPDMVGGGDLGVVDMHKPLDQELFVRFAQASALFPIIQFSMMDYLGYHDRAKTYLDTFLATQGQGSMECVDKMREAFVRRRDFAMGTAVSLMKSLIGFLLVWATNTISKKLTDTSIF